MRVVALEEHFTVPDLVKKYIKPEAIAARGFKPRKLAPGRVNPMELAPEIGERRLKYMDDAGVTVHVISNTGPGPDLVPGPDGITLAKAMNDQLATMCAKNPERFAGLAVLPMASPKDCAAELRRAVKDLGFVGPMINGTCEGRFLDNPVYDDILAAASSSTCRSTFIRICRRTRCGRPTTPGSSPAPGACWKAPAGAGTRRPRSTRCAWCCPARSTSIRKLKLIIGHMGEMLPVMLARVDETSVADIDHLSGRRASRSWIRSGSPPAASSASRRSWPRCRPSASTASCSRSTIRMRSIRRAASSSTRSASRPPTWRSSVTATPTQC